MKSSGGYGAQRSQPYGGGGESYDGRSEFVLISGNFKEILHSEKKYIFLALLICLLLHIGAAKTFVIIRQVIPQLVLKSENFEELTV
jgi:hypothetical protein